MKRIILIIGALLLGLAARAQSVTYTCRYWFDQNHAQAVTTTFGENGWEAELDVGNLTDGIHALHLHVLAADTVSVLGIENDSLYHAADTTLMKWSSPQSFLFMKVSDTPSADLEYRYWFDQDYSAVQSGSVGTGFMLLDVAHLEEGLHVLHVMLKGTEYTAAQSYLFLKMDAWEQGTPNYVYHCWFDEDYANQQSDSLGDGHLLLDVNGLDEGMHSVHVMVEGSTLTATQNYLFMKVAPFSADTLDMTHLAYHCWFDQDFEHRVTDSLGNGNLLLDVGSLDEGIHSVHVLLEGSTLTATQSYLFMKVAPMAADTLDMTHLAYHCWFDQDFEHRVTDSLGNGNLLLDVGSLDDGLHTVHVLLEGSTLTATQSYMFMKMAVEDPTTELQYICWFDQDYSNVQTGLVGSGLVELDVADLPNGIHTVNVQLDNGTRTSPQTYLFYKQPLGGYGVARWEYWINDDFDGRTKTILPASVDTLDIVTLLPVGHPALRSSCFHFHPNGDEPYINAKNQISFRIWDAEMRFLDMTRFFVDEQVQQDIVAQVFERNTTETFAAPRDNQIQWFKLDAVVGDSLSFIASKACTMQLFAPSGEEVFNVSGPESIILKGLHAWEDGTYYLAVHDMTGSGETVSVTYNWVYRYAILAYDVHLVGNGGCSTITFQGNGFNSLLDVYLVNAQNDTIRRLDIGHESNSTTTVTFNFYGVNLGVYDAVFEFYDETIRVNGALEVQGPTPILLTNSVSYPYSFMSGRPVTYSYTITNHGNMSAYGIPIYVFISTLSSGNVTHVKIEGLNLPSLIDGMDLDSLSEAEINELRAFSNDYGDLHHFFALNSVDEQSGQPINVLSGFFFMNVAPLESKTINIVVTEKTGAHKPLKVWVTVPNDTVQPLILNERGIRDQYCCVKDKMECVLNIAADVSGLLSNIPGAWGSVAQISNCITASLSTLSSSIGYWVCREEGDPLPFDINSMAGNTNSYVSLIMDCFKKLLPTEAFSQLKAILDGKGFAGLRTAFGIVQDINDCVTAFTQSKPDCPPGNEEGGTSDEVTPEDPNDIHGYLSESGSHYMRQEIQNVQYEIEFENDTTLATAAAHTIIVRDTLDATKFDLNSLAARSVTIGDKRLDLNGEQTFARTLDMRPELYVIAQVEQDYDPTTGIIQWTIQSLDPMTMEPTDDPNQGVLPVNFYGDGVGFIDYSIDIKEAFADGTEISNRAGIIFDQNEVIMTPTWTNIIDAVKPTSQIVSVEAMSDSLSFSFVSEDNRSGVWYHTLYYRNDSTQMEWQVKKAQILGNGFMLNPELLTTEYLVMAVDSAGNREEKEMVAEYIYYYEGPGLATQTDNLSAGWNWWSSYIEMNGTNGLELLEDGLGTSGLSIKSSNGNSVEYIPDWEMWWGDEIAVRNESMYEINVAQAGTVTVAGTQAIPGVHPITLAPGWNWIGYPVNASLATETALASLSPTEEDVIQSRSGYSMYWPDFGFWGDVEYMTPGSGYKYMSNNAQPQTLVYPSSRGKALAYKPKTVETRPEAMQHQYLMDIVAVAELEGEELEASHYELIALSDGQVRGRASLRYCEPNGRHVAMLLVYGDASETLEFRLLDTESGKVYESAERMDFKADKVVGGLRKPFTMHFGSEQEDAFALESMFPNPAKAGETVYVNMVDTSIEASVTDMELFNALGERIPVSHSKGSPLSFQAPKAAGVYVVRLTANGETYHGTLIVTR